METVEIGKGLVALCNQGRHLEAIKRYYAEDIVSIEGDPPPGIERRLVGIAAVRGKNLWWQRHHEVHIHRVEGPFVARGSNLFAAYFYVDATRLDDGLRRQASEVGLYRVDGGKIVEERFLVAANNGG